MSVSSMKMRTSSSLEPVIADTVVALLSYLKPAEVARNSRYSYVIPPLDEEDLIIAEEVVNVLSRKYPIDASAVMERVRKAVMKDKKLGAIPIEKRSD